MEHIDKRAAIWTFAVGVLVAALTVVGWRVWSEVRAEGNLRRDRQEATTYLDKVEPLARGGGEIAALRMKPEIADLMESAVSSEVLAQRATTWVAEFEDLYDRWAQEEPPPELAAAHTRFLEALSSYADVARAIGDAADDAPARRTRAAARAADLGEAADAIWDRGATMVQRYLREIDLATVSWLPGYSAGRGASP